MATATTEKKKGGFRNYLRGVKTEMKKVVWPTREELKSYFIMVLFACAFFAVGFFLLDTLFAAGLNLIIGR